METEAKYFFVGTLVTLLAIGLVSFVIWVSDIGAYRNVNRYLVYFKDHSLSGLQSDSDVTMMGIKVGSVESFEISPKDPQQVSVILRVNENIPVKTDTKAIIRRNLLTGLARVELVGGSQDSHELTDVMAGKPYPVIEEGRTELEQIADSAPGLIENVGELVGRAKLLLSSEAIESFNQSAKNAEEFTAFLAENTERFQTLTEQLVAVTADLKQLSASVKTTTSKADQNMDRISEDLIRAINQVEQTAKTLEEESKTVGGSINRGTNRLTLEIVSVAREISQAAQAFSATLEQFEDPRSILAGPSDQALGPGEQKIIGK